MKIELHKKIILVILLMAVFHLCPISQVKSQYHGNYSQFISNDHVINPAFAGAEEALSLTVVGRSQWSGIQGAPSTQTFTGHTLFKNEKTGVGVTLINDEIGVHRSLTSLATYAYRIKVNELSNGYLSFGLQFGAITRRSDYTSLDPEDPALIGLSDRKTSFAFGSGVYYKDDRLSFGLSVPNLLRRDLGSSVDSNSRFTTSEFLFLSKYKLPLDHKFTLQPGIFVKYLPGLPVFYDVTMSVIVNEALLLGATYSSSKMGIAMIQANISRQLKIGYSYDFALGNRTGLTANSHELMINFLFRYKSSNATGPR